MWDNSQRETWYMQTRGQGDRADSEMTKEAQMYVCPNGPKISPDSDAWVIQRLYCECPRSPCPQD